MKNTGERIIPKEESRSFESSKKRYVFACEQISHLKFPAILDIACGTGYGTSILSEISPKVVGVDIDKETINFCKDNYKNVDFKLIESAEKPIPDFLNRFDVVISFETLEHVTDHKAMLESLRKYLRESAILILSTPNNIYKRYPPANPFHTYEFETLELLEILEETFPGFDITVYGQGKTTSNISDPKIKENQLTKLIRNFYGFVFNIDKGTLNILGKLENTRIYKKFGRLQKPYEPNDDIYEIDASSDFLIPEINIYVIRNNQ